MKSAYLVVAGFCVAVSPAAAQVFSINDALRQTVQTNPGVGEASANRRATEGELRQTQSTLLPQVRIEPVSDLKNSTKVPVSWAIYRCRPQVLVLGETGARNRSSSDRFFSTDLLQFMTSGDRPRGLTPPRPA